MIHLIDKFETTLSEINGTITVNYRHDILTGYWEYRIVEVNNRFKQSSMAFESQLKVAVKIVCLSYGQTSIIIYNIS